MLLPFSLVRSWSLPSRNLPVRSPGPTIAEGDRKVQSRAVSLRSRSPSNIRLRRSGRRFRRPSTSCSDGRAIISARSSGRRGDTTPRCPDNGDQISSGDVTSKPYVSAPVIERPMSSRARGCARVRDRGKPPSIGLREAETCRRRPSVYILDCVHIHIEGYPMPLHIKDQAATDAVRRLARARKLTLTDAVRIACLEALERDDRARPIADRLAD